MTDKNYSSIQVTFRGLSLTVRMHSPYARKNRRAFLLMLFRAVKEQVRELNLYSLTHYDDPITTGISQMIRGIKAPDALGRTTFKQDLGFKIRALRTRAKLTQKEFARMAGVSQTLVSHIEHGRRTPKEKIAFLTDILTRNFAETLVNLPPQSSESFLRSEPKSQSIRREFVEQTSIHAK